jgi:hypothetical protein
MRILLRGNVSSIEVERQRANEISLVVKPKYYCETCLKACVLIMF